MSEDALAQRRNWFRFFPDGSIEFVVVTCVLAVLLLLALAIVREAERPAALVVLAGVLWIDYLLTLWWLVQLTTDLEALSADPPPSTGGLRRRRVRAAILGALPATIALVILAPWQHFALSTEASRIAVTRVALPLLCLLFVGTAVVACRELRRIRMGAPLWTLVLLIPVLHWFAMHRLLAGLQARIHQRAVEDGRATAHDSGAGAVILLADVTWVLSIMPWAVLAILTVVGEWPRAMPGSAIPPCGTALVALFAVAEVAAMENIQRQFVALIRKA